MAGSLPIPPLTQPVGLFPLPNVVLLPGATLPLQVFEERYRAMVRDALDDNELIAMALLRPGFEPHYHTNKAEIHPVVCVGRIQEHVKVPDGRYFINLRGVCRARIRQEHRDGEYREAMLDPMIRPTSGVDTDGEYAARVALGEMLALKDFDDIEDIDELRGAFSDNTRLDEAVDFTAALLLPQESVEIRQRLLEEMNIVERSRTLLNELKLLHRILEARKSRNDQWPRFGSMN